MAERVKSWRAWAVVDARDNYSPRVHGYHLDALADYKRAKDLVDGRFRIVRVTITVDEKKRRKGKR